MVCQRRLEPGSAEQGSEPRCGTCWRRIKRNGHTFVIDRTISVLAFSRVAAKICVRRGAWHRASSCENVKVWEPDAWLNLFVVSEIIGRGPFPFLTFGSSRLSLQNIMEKGAAFQ
jgi:hypothetical protein